MDARDLPSTSSPVARRVARAVACVLALLLAWGLWLGYGALLARGHVH